MLVLVRHGQSQWNLENRFTGWVDIDLTPQGEQEARKAGERLNDLSFDVAFTSVLKRARHTLTIILEETHQTNIPIYKDKALNERNYGDLQGKNKAEMAEKMGEEQVHIWRRRYDVAPPNGESLKDTKARVLPYYKNHIRPVLKDGKNVLISAHGNSLRALIMELEGVSPKAIPHLNISTGSPIAYEFNSSMSVVRL